MMLDSPPVLFWLAEPMSFLQGMLLIGAILVGTLIFVAVGAYAAIRLIANRFNSGRDEWESSAERLGLTVDKSVQTLHKPLIGTRNGHTIRVEYYSVPKSRYSFTNCASAEASFDKPLGLSLNMEKAPWLHQMAAGLAGSDVETGHDLLDKAFRVSCSDPTSLMKLLHLEMLEGKNTTLLNDLLMSANRYQRVNITERSVTIGIAAEPGNADPINSAIEQAIYLAERFDAARLRQHGS